MTALQTLQAFFHTKAYDSVSDKLRARFAYFVGILIAIADIFIGYLLPQEPGEPIALIVSLQEGVTIGNVASFVIILIAVGYVLAVRAGYLRSASWLFMVAFSAAIFFGVLDVGIVEILSVSALAFLILLAGLLLSRLGVAVFTIVTVVGYVAVNLVAGQPLDFALMVIYLVVGLTTYSFIQIADANLDEGALQADQERVKLAELTTRITGLATQRATLEEAMYTVLNLILSNYPRIYHAQIFLLREDDVQADLVASTGEVGQTLIEESHGLAVGSFSVIGQTTFKGEPVIAYADAKDTIHRPNKHLPETKLEAAFPLRIENRIIGALDLQSKEAFVLTDEDRFSYQSLADSLSLVIDNIRQFQDAQERVTENQRLADQARSALREVERLNQRLIGRAWSEYLEVQGSEMGVDINFETDETHNQVVWTSTLLEAARSSSFVQESGVIAVPLRVRGHVVGAMEFELGDTYAFSPEDLELIQDVANRFGLAIENTRLVDESQRVAQRETLINEISSRVQTANNVEATLTEAARSLSETLQANKVAIRLGAPQGNGANGKEA